MKYLLLSLLVISITVSCRDAGGSQQVEKLPATAVLNKDSVFKLIDHALMFGDSKAYNRASAYYFIRDNAEEFLYVAFVMANKYDNSEACYHVYQILNSTRNQEQLEKLDERTKKVALFYLLRSYEMGYDQSKYELEQIFKKGEMIPKSSSYLNLLATERKS
nr:hypothetical protein [uncultured Lacibacter sp.]